MTSKIEGWTLDKAVGPDVHLTQGDLIKFYDAGDPLKAAGVVVTADCDLKNRKHARMVTLVPLVSAAATMEHYLLPEACERQRKQIFEFACKAFQIDSSNDSLIAEAQLREVVETAQQLSPERIAAEFLLNQQDSMPVAAYTILMKAIGSQPKGAAAFETQLLTKGDIVVLPSAKELGVENDIAWVRHIWQEPVGQIAIRTSDVKYCRGERIARLDSPYRYRLTQVMAQVFSDIGLPDSDRKFKDDIEKVLANA